MKTIIHASRAEYRSSDRPCIQYERTELTHGGAFDNFEQSSRSASRSVFNAGPSDTDTDLGFRVMLVTGP